ncbi:MAG: hypothetical protein ABI811_15255 [Acidobacteriota bacterium]
MSAYSESGEEALHARNLLKDWASEWLLTETQYQHMQQETVCEFRRTNIFLRLALFFFTLIIVAAAAGLVFMAFLSHAKAPTIGVFLLFIAGISYAAAEFAVSRFRLYRYGIEEALVACAVGSLCMGIEATLFTDRLFSAQANFVVPAAGAIASLWIWRRFGLPYAFPAALIFVFWVPGLWTSSPSVRHLIVAAIYVAGLVTVAAVRPHHLLTYLNSRYSAAEAALWGGIYVSINIQLSSLEQTTAGFSRTFYWASWVLTWCLPPAILARGVRQKDRFVIAVGAIAAVLTLATNKSYLGWPRHTWDPMLLGALLIGVALLLRRWLARGAGGIRQGFTAQRLSGKDKQWMNAASAAIGLVTPQSITLGPQATNPDVRFGGGESGGGGASSDF